MENDRLVCGGSQGMKRECAQHNATALLCTVVFRYYWTARILPVLFRPGKPDTIPRGASRAFILPPQSRANHPGLLLCIIIGRGVAWTKAWLRASGG